MAITLNALVKATPFNNETREKLLKNLHFFNEDERLKLSRICWQALAALFDNELKYKSNLLLAEIQEGKRKFDQKDFDELKAKMYFEFAQKLEAAKSEASVEEVKKEIEVHLRAPNGKSQTPSTKS